MTVTVLGIDLAKHVFQLHGIDATGKAVIRRTVSRKRFIDTVAAHGPDLIAFEAGSGAHHWARQLQALGYKIKMISPQYVKPFRRGSSKDDAADAEAIVEAALRPSIPAVAVKQLWQQDIQMMHRIRQDLVERRTGLCNQYRGHLVECGLAPAQSVGALRLAVADIVHGGDAAASERVPPMLRRWLAHFLEQLDNVEAELELATAEIERSNLTREASARLKEIPGVGPMTVSAAQATFGDGNFIKNGRQAAAFLGLTPRRYGSGGKSQNLGITKQGNTYLRSLLIHGGRAVASAAKRYPERASPWVKRLVATKPINVAAVAVAHRNARLIWKLLASGERYDARRAAGGV